MKLQFKLALYNTLTKVAIITMLGILILVSINRISINHIQQRLLQKKKRLVTNLSGVEVNDLLTQKIYTDYNLLREEYIILKEIRNDEKPIKQQFTRELRSIEGSQEEFQILTTDFNYAGRNYRLELGETMSTLAQLERTISMFTFGILIAAVILTLITDLAFTRFLLTPFYRIIDQKLNKVNEPTNFNYKPIQTSTEDFRILDRSISALMRKITGLFLTEKEFIANVSHELLTPISVLNTRLENLLNDEKLTTEGENKIFASLKTLGRLKAIINSLLLISKVENNQYSKPDTISVRHTVEEVYEELEHRLLMMKLKFNIQLTHDHTFTGNRSLFHTLITNLISNAIKYNIPSGSVNISDAPTAEAYTLVIADTGIGMNAELLEHAFIRFEKLESEREDSHGLGLAIVRSIASFHELKIDIKSEKGKGTEIRINFPQ
ncbi:sensor histidine kinase [Pedobacter africanus]|uniref:histidine kinase n=1 Tax=Pedobacter africanus TaxID=151894 RepID=A0A1W2DSQ2_9SPHI|nr:HAMP domain-containing sensor histidine kinase [Pedobacter africanus]SMD00480.1 Signal transduction histidine kinase [Pedobacter africanus]